MDTFMRKRVGLGISSDAATMRQYAKYLYLY